MTKVTDERIKQIKASPLDATSHEITSLCHEASDSRDWDNMAAFLVALAFVIGIAACLAVVGFPQAQSCQALPC